MYIYILIILFELTRMSEVLKNLNVKTANLYMFNLCGIISGCKILLWYIDMTFTNILYN